MSLYADWRKQYDRARRKQHAVEFIGLTLQRDQ